MNKGDLARFLGMSLPTLNNRLATDPDLPVVQRGTNGHPWVFDAQAVKAHLDRKAQLRAEEEAARKAYLDSIQMDGLGPSEGQRRGSSALTALAKSPMPPLIAAAASAAVVNAVLQAAEDFAAKHGLAAAVATELKERLRTAIQGQR
ncbi:terminase small subunit [Falsiroseomonas tokyonensis]|uniref:Terminase small subunit n=1 Tax=Falsiroseomonas tokyonensis TaxID=430521 RepID=A0ABV7BSV6_9PROT|nr:terminase small subunit [Falsiroseomonas tokyonensis]MBU8538718.1 hypothetical protein [Falsiroseomonas tokyonensis]